jgi:hypothetical protein
MGTEFTQSLETGAYIRAVKPLHGLVYDHGANVAPKQVPHLRSVAEGARPDNDVIGAA